MFLTGPLVGLSKVADGGDTHASSGLVGHMVLQREFYASFLHETEGIA